MFKKCCQTVPVVHKSVSVVISPVASKPVVHGLKSVSDDAAPKDSQAAKSNTAMNLHLSLTPYGTLLLRPDSNTAQDIRPQPTFYNTLKQNGEAAALFSLAIDSDASQLTDTEKFWRSFGTRWLRERCLLDAIIANETQVKPLDDQHAQSLIDSAPLMDGGEYLSTTLLQDKWLNLDDWLLKQLQSNDSTFADFMQTHAPDWHVGGTLYFHLAENRSDDTLPFAFIATWQPQQAGGSQKHIPLSKALEHYSSTQQNDLLRDLLEPVQLAAQSSALIAKLIESRAIYRAQAWSAHQAWQFLREVPLLQNCGVIVRLPDWWAKRTRPQISTTVSTGTSIGAEQLLSFKVSTVLDGEKLTAKEWKQLMNSDTGLVFLKGKWVEVDQDKLHEAMQQMQSLANEAQTNGLTFAQGMRLLAGAPHDLTGNDTHAHTEGWRFIEAAPALAKTLANMRDPQQLNTRLPTSRLNAYLRPYQKTGARWLWHLNQLGLGACLADDMGLGKTIQVITLLLMIRKKPQAKPCLLILPTSLLGNWKAELEQFAPSINCCFVHKAMTDQKTLISWRDSGLPTQTDLVLTSYGTLPRQGWLHEQQWHTVIIDEAQAIKNPGTRQAKAVKQLSS